MSSGANSPASSSAADAASAAAGGKGANSGPTDGADAKGDKGGQKAAWADGEVEAMKAELRAHGRNWAALAGKISTKTAEQCKKFFYENRKKCGLDKIILEYKRVSANLRSQELDGKVNSLLFVSGQVSGSTALALHRRGVRVLHVVLRRRPDDGHEQAVQKQLSCHQEQRWVNDTVQTCKIPRIVSVPSSL